MTAPPPLRCARGHASTESDYCSVCGAPVVATVTACPDCGEQRADAAARFCDICRYDFRASKPGPPPSASLAWEVVVSFDPALDEHPDPGTPFPSDASLVGERRVAVGARDVVIGRRDGDAAAPPDIDLPDPGASRRHAKIVRGADGALVLVDLAPANATRVNGAPLAPGARLALRSGDEITLGRWTRVKLVAVRAR